MKKLVNYVFITVFALGAISAAQAKERQIDDFRVLEQYSTINYCIKIFGKEKMCFIQDRDELLIEKEAYIKIKNTYPGITSKLKFQIISDEEYNNSRLNVEYYVTFKPSPFGGQDLISLKGMCVGRCGAAVVGGAGLGGIGGSIIGPGGIIIGGIAGGAGAYGTADACSDTCTEREEADRAAAREARKKKGN